MKVNSIGAYSCVQTASAKNDQHQNVNFKQIVPPIVARTAACSAFCMPILKIITDAVKEFFKDDSDDNENNKQANEEKEDVLSYSEEYHPAEDLAYTNY